MMQRFVFGVLVPVLCFAAAAEERSPISLTADRDTYRPGETMYLTIATESDGPYDVYLKLSGPAGALWADEQLDFKRRFAAAARNFNLAAGEITVPVSLSTKELARPGEYTLEALAVPPGQDPRLVNTAPQRRKTIFIISLPGVNFVAMHNPGSSRYRSDCFTCHIDKTENKSLVPNILSMHPLKVRIFMGGEYPELTCRVCHEGADLLEFSQAALRKQANPDQCALCHSRFGPGKRLYAK